MARDEDLVQFERLFWRVSRKIQCLRKKKFNDRLSDSQTYILVKLATEGPQKVSGLAESIGITPGGVTSISDKLIANGYAQRKRDEEDRRVVFLEITDKGMDVMRELHQERLEIIRYLFNNLPADDLQHLNRTYEKLLENLDKYEKEMLEE
ncbi:MarR family transcriptional regulator [Paenibacillus thiaminolyticus]|uniref:MarR family winged helix-turn-helix transcriptional regulator n=1 Tax=Paenibacillus thiaminolyticus TaxID=49283 RepID=UPI00116380D6|nr:MarR family transcriptional regulator [Paenibacillus thiaminolyticus]NGP56862.1 MarR family transcriptional regulator [Paenibacillus thiaminolyticus]WCR27934.1 MarR family transcriptional regulator [Paenibacillus thiaminolyticus]